jgi:serine/threonine-protein kinase
VRDRVLPPREAADLLLPVCAGLAVAHDEGVVHRDLKPENIFLVRRRQGGVEPKVLDFGISKVTGKNAVAMTGTMATFGTPYYMPPEQVRGARQADQRSDVYALGVVLYECVTGRRPFEGENIYAMLHAIGSGEFSPPRAVKPDLPADVEAVIVRAMATDPAGRFQNVRQLAAALLPFASDKARLLWGEAFGGGEAAAHAEPGPATGARTRGGSSVPAAITPVLATAETMTPPPTARTGKGITLGSATGYQAETMRSAPRSRLGAVVGGALVVGALALLGFKLVRPTSQTAAAPSNPTPPTSALAPASADPPSSAARPAAAPPTFHLEVDAEPASATLALDGVETGSPSLRRDLPVDGRPHRLVGHAAGYRDAVATFTNAPPDRRLVLEPVALAPADASTSSGSRREAHAHAHGHPKPHGPAAPAAAPVPAPAADKPAPMNRAPVID